MSLYEYTESVAAFPPGQASIHLEDSNGHIHPVNDIDPDIVVQVGGTLTRFFFFFFGDYGLEDPDEPIEVKLLLHLEVFYVAEDIECEFP
ncbi:hypothetical protein GTA08_BOTSDO08472 [Botryosphaeria dothidea]|uniref:Uncharacterized protein n=1 Tax=Botryosphaeria dothidea TaxID=55169 RepID=A0A8H4IM83_9PEZI|nr:hypothetical protein GTA08_BOTSDO08472 [Botryosphaeria dothidea]